jgi:hypothetical protein
MFLSIGFGYMLWLIWKSRPFVRPYLIRSQRGGEETELQGWRVLDSADDVGAEGQVSSDGVMGENLV